MSKEVDNPIQAKIAELKTAIRNNSNEELKNMIISRINSAYYLDDDVVNTLFVYAFENENNTPDDIVLKFCEYKLFSELRLSYQKSTLNLPNLTNDEILELLHYESVYQKYSHKTEVRFIVDLLTERIFDKDFQIPEANEKIIKEALTGIPLPYKRDSREGKAIRELFKSSYEHTDELKARLDELIKILLLDLDPFNENDISENENQN